jgi:hypothetical protein
LKTEDSVEKNQGIFILGQTVAVDNRRAGLLDGKMLGEPAWKGIKYQPVGH